MPKPETLSRLAEKLYANDYTTAPIIMYIIRHNLYQEVPYGISPETWERYLLQTIRYFLDISRQKPASVNVIQGALQERYFQKTLREDFQREVKTPNLERYNAAELRGLIEITNDRAYLQHILDHVTQKNVTELLALVPKVLTPLHIVIWKSAQNFSPAEAIAIKQHLLRAQIPFAEVGTDTYLPTALTHQAIQVLVKYAQETPMPPAHVPVHMMPQSITKHETSSDQELTEKLPEDITNIETTPLHELRLPYPANRIFTEDPQLKTLLVTVITKRLYRENLTSRFHTEVERNARITLLYYYKGLTLEEVGALFPVNGKPLTRERVRQIINNTISRWRRFLIKDGIMVIDYIDSLRSLTGLPHQVAIFIASHPELEGEALASAARQEFGLTITKFRALKNTIEKYGVYHPGPSLKLEAKKRHEILLTSTNFEESNAVLQTLTRSSNKKDKRFQPIMSISEAAEAAFGFKIAHSAVKTLYQYLVDSKKVPTKTLALDEKKNPGALYYVIPRGFLEVAVDLLRELPNPEQYKLIGVQYAEKGAKDRPLPSVSQFNEYSSLRKLLVRLGIRMNSRAEKLLDKIDVDCPITIFQHNDSCAFHPEDEAVLIAYLVAKYSSGK